MTGERNLNAIDRYAHELTEALMPGSQVLVSPMDSRNVANGTYAIITPDHRFGLIKFAIPEALLIRDDAHEVYTRTLEEISREADIITTIKSGIKDQAEDFIERGDTPPSIWVPEVYVRDERGFIREWLAGKYVTQIEDLTVDETKRWAKDLTTLTEGLGYAGFDVLAMEKGQPATHGPAIRTKFIRHYSPYTGTVVLSPTQYQGLVDETSKTFQSLQQADFIQAAWLIGLAQRNEEQRANQSE